MDRIFQRIFTFYRWIATPASRARNEISRQGPRNEILCANTTKLSLPRLNHHEQPRARKEAADKPAGPEFLYQ